MGEDGAACGCGPVVEDSSEVINSGALVDVCSQQLEKGNSITIGFLRLGLILGL